LSIGEKTFFFNFEPYNLANIYVRFGGHINIQTNSNFLIVRSTKKNSILYNFLAFKRDCFEAVLDSMWALMFRGYIYKNANCKPKSMGSDCLKVNFLVSL
jgi:hypothetical protein